MNRRRRMFNTIKNTLSSYLNEAASKLSDEDISTLSKIKDGGITSILKTIIQHKSFNSVSLINIAYALNNDNETIKNKIKEDNIRLLEELLKVENPLIFTDVLNKFYEPKHAKSVRIVTKLSDIKTARLDVKTLQETPLITFINEYYINPYNNGLFLLNTRNEVGADVVTFKSPENRKITATLTMSLLSQNNWLIYGGKDNAGLNYSFNQEQIARMGVEFVLFHELSHATARKYMLDGNQDEAFADICGIIQVIKNNDLSQDDAIKFVNKIILYRSQPSSIAYYAIDFENDPDQRSPNRYHFTQDYLMTLRDLLSKNLEKIKEMSISEQAIFSSNVVTTQSVSANIENIRDRLCIYNRAMANTFIDDLLANDIEYLDKLAEVHSLTTIALIDRIKKNIIDDPRKILDINLHILYKHDEDMLYKIESFSAYPSSFIMKYHKESLENYKELQIERNFSYSDLVKELDKKKIKRKPNF